MTPNRIITSSEFNKKPVWFSAVNHLWKGAYALGAEVPLNKDRLIKSAKADCGFTDLGSDFWDEPLDKLLYSINHEADLHPIGRFITKKRLENLLCVRLRAEHYFKKYPEILEQEIYPMTVIMGLQRTGTTKLQRLLSADPECRALLSWEALNPAPIKGDDHTGKERIKFAKMSEQALKYMSPGFFAIHPVEHLAPEEDVLMLDVSFQSTTAEATMRVPTYAAWLETIDQSNAYAYNAKLLRFLQWQRPGKRWVLKTPHHLEFPDLVLKHYGNVQFVWTHREVLEAIPSFLSMVAYSRGLFSNSIDINEIAQHWVRKIGFMLDRAMDFRNEDDHNKMFVDIHFHELVSDSASVLSKIYSHRNQSISPLLEKYFIENEQKNPKGKYGSHKYQVSDFGITNDSILKETSAYQQFLHRLKSVNEK